MEADESLKQEVLQLVPQQEPFRFIDEIISLDDEQIVGAYRFRKDEYFYRGHFPGNPLRRRYSYRNNGAGRGCGVWYISSFPPEKHAAGTDEIAHQFVFPGGLHRVQTSCEAG